MILPVGNAQNKINFSADKSSKELEYSHDTLLKNNLSTRTKIQADKLTNAITVYPAKGFKGSKNANFYEFLTMGTVPYLIGSGTLMAVFNAANKYYSPFQKTMAGKYGNKLALGVLFYGIMKNFSKSFISKPIKLLTGIDTEMPYAKVIYELPDDINDTDITSIEHHKVFESVEFPRWDLLYGDEAKGEKRNFRYDKIANKLGMGENLKDSDQEVKPRIKEIVVKSSLAKNISSYFWAACGVALAVQEPWEKYFKVMTFKFWKGKEFMKSLKSFGSSFTESVEAFWKGEGKGLKKHAGKILFGAAVLSSVLGVINTMSSSKTPSKIDSADVIKKSDRYVVD
ncbi:hypothetical protein J6P92_00095 [bacterium]|nr:hypothetical protein [bacterium]